MSRALGITALVAAICLPAGSAASSEETRTVEVTATVHGVGRTPEEARREALHRARDKAIAEVTGVQIAAQQLRLKSEASGAVHDAFSYLVHTSTQGRIVREEVSYRTELVDEIPIYRATLLAEVALEEGARDPGFTVDLRASPDTRTLRHGEGIAIEVTATRDSYLTVVNVRSDGAVAVLFPNRYDDDNRAPARLTVRLPRPSRGFEMRARLNDGRAREYEQVLVIATLDPVPFHFEASDDEMVPETDRDAGLTALNRWLLQIPVNRRAEALWDYEVVR
jgi:hypothetical protein